MTRQPTRIWGKKWRLNTDNHGQECVRTACQCYHAQRIRRHWINTGIVPAPRHVPVRALPSDRWPGKP